MRSLLITIFLLNRKHVNSFSNVDSKLLSRIWLHLQDTFSTIYQSVTHASVVKYLLYTSLIYLAPRKYLFSWRNVSCVPLVVSGSWADDRHNIVMSWAIFYSHIIIIYKTLLSVSDSIFISRNHKHFQWLQYFYNSLCNFL